MVLPNNYAILLWGSLVGTLCMLPKIITHRAFINDFCGLVQNKALPAAVQLKKLYAEWRSCFPKEPRHKEEQQLLPS